MKTFSPSLKISNPVKRPLPQNAIYWGCVPGGDPTRFPPDLDAIRQRRDMVIAEPLSYFVDAVREAQERIWILDGYFFASPSEKIDNEDYVLEIANWFHARLDATDIRILTKVHQQFSTDMASLFRIQENEINRLRGGGKQKCSIKIRQTLKQKFDFMHDRFAVVDDELWHFGATVGGFHTSVSAVSRGWCANETGAVHFFNLAWREME
jgi:phosphatidylserine/phosphatidylglycerophosphate/cardiolipin synthase-like enzyme